MQALSAFRAQIVNILKYDIFKKSMSVILQILKQIIHYPVFPVN